jgi:hypothetical protein
MRRTILLLFCATDSEIWQEPNLTGSDESLVFNSSTALNSRLMIDLFGANGRCRRDQVVLGGRFHGPPDVDASAQLWISNAEEPLRSASICRPQLGHHASRDAEPRKRLRRHPQGARRRRELA